MNADHPYLARIKQRKDELRRRKATLATSALRQWALDQDPPEDVARALAFVCVLAENAAEREKEQINETPIRRTLRLFSEARLLNTTYPETRDGELKIPPRDLHELEFAVSSAESVLETIESKG